jgi:mannose-6-phosphate isomerase-like protein (cupin superfamily)
LIAQLPEEYIMPPKNQALPQIIRPPSEFRESFAADQTSRGNTTWKTLFSSQLAAGISSCPPKSKATCPSPTHNGLGFLASHRHSQAEVYHILSGRGIVTIEGVDYEVNAGTTVFIPGDAEHAVRNEGSVDFKWLYVFPGTFEEVEYRFRHEGAYGEPKL